MATQYFTKREESPSAVSLVGWWDSLPVGSPDVPLVARVPLAVDTLKARPVRWMWLQHNQDKEDDGTPAKDHVHVALWFGRGIGIGPVADAFGILVTQIPKYKGKLDPFRTAMYFLHWDNDSIDAGKHYYDLSELCFGGDWLRSGKDLQMDLLKRLEAVQQGVDLGVLDVNQVWDLLDDWLLMVSSPQECTLRGFGRYCCANIPAMSKSLLLWITRDRSIWEAVSERRSQLWEQVRALAEQARQEREEARRS